MDFRCLRELISHVTSALQVQPTINCSSTSWTNADATLPSLGAPRLYGAAETYYLADTSLRLEYGRAFATQAVQNQRLQRVSFWTTPGGEPNNDEQNSAYPFTIEDFLPEPPP